MVVVIVVVAAVAGQQDSGVFLLSAVAQGCGGVICVYVICGVCQAGDIVIAAALPRCLLPCCRLC